MKKKIKFDELCLVVIMMEQDMFVLVQHHIQEVDVKPI